MSFREALPRGQGVTTKQEEKLAESRRGNDSFRRDVITACLQGRAGGRRLGLNAPKLRRRSRLVMAFCLF